MKKIVLSALLRPSKEGVAAKVAHSRSSTLRHPHEADANPPRSLPNGFSEAMEPATV